MSPPSSSRIGFHNRFSPWEYFDLQPQRRQTAPHQRASTTDVEVSHTFIQTSAQLLQLPTVSARDDALHPVIVFRRYREAQHRMRLCLEGDLFLAYSTAKSNLHGCRWRARAEAHAVVAPFYRCSNIQGEKVPVFFSS